MQHDIPATTPSARGGRELIAGLWGERPQRLGRMTDPGSALKYYIIKDDDGNDVTLTDRQIAAHLCGKATFAAPLIGADGLCRSLVIELDEGGAATARRVLDITAAAGLTAFSVAVRGSDGHDGSHTWVLYEEGWPPERVRAQSIQILTAAKLPHKEVYPSRKMIRLPFGLHRRRGLRGHLLLPSGDVYDLDTPDGLRAGGAAVCALPLNTLPPPPPIQVQDDTDPAPRPTRTRSTGLLPGEDFNQRCSQDEVVRMVTGRGWAVTGSRGDIVFLRRPGKTDGMSATLGYFEDADNMLCSFTTSDPDLPARGLDGPTGYTPWAVLTFLYHQGDFSASARYLYERGYGEDRKRYSRRLA